MTPFRKQLVEKVMWSHAVTGVVREDLTFNIIFLYRKEKLRATYSFPFFSAFIMIEEAIL